MSNKIGRSTYRANFMPKDMRCAKNHDMMSEAKKNTEETECIAKLLDQEVLSDAHFATIMKQVNELLIQREKKQP